LRDCGAGLRRPGEGGVEVVGLDDVEAAQMFLRLGEGAVGGQYVTVGHAYDRCGLGFVQGAAKEPGAVRLHLLLQKADPPHELLHLLLGHRVTGLALDAVDGQQVLRHRGPPLDGRALPASHPHYERASVRLTGRLTWEAATRLAPRLLCPLIQLHAFQPFKPRIGRQMKPIGRHAVSRAPVFAVGESGSLRYPGLQLSRTIRRRGRPSLAARGVKLSRIQKEWTMRKSSRTTAHIQNYGPVEERRE